MKKSFVQVFDVGDDSFGQLSDPRDLMLAEDFAHDHVSVVTSDFINNANHSEVKGFSFELGVGNAFNMTLSRPGSIYTPDGIQYELLNETTLTFEAADATYPRFDLVIGKLEDEVPAELDLIPFVNLGTEEQANYSKPTQKHWRVTPQIKKGTASANPAFPSLDSNEVLLYVVSISRGVTQLRTSDVTDVRRQLPTLRDLTSAVTSNKSDIEDLKAEIDAVKDLSGQPINIDGKIQTVRDWLLSILGQIGGSSDLPEIRYDNPKYALTDKRTSQIGAAGNTDTGAPCVDIEVGGKFNFGISEVQILPQNFDPSLNARYVNTGGGGSAHVQRTVDLTLGGVTSLSSDGFTDFVQRSSQFGAARSRPAAAARDAQFIEVFGGLADDNATGLSDWYTYDVINDTLTLQTLTGTALPTSNRPALFSCGDGVNLMLIAGNDGSTTPRCFRINAVTRVVTEITTAKPTGIQFFGDTITAGKVFIVAVQTTYESSASLWEYDTTAHTYTQVNPGGQVPNVALDKGSGCILSDGKFLLLSYLYASIQNQPPEQGISFIYDRASSYITTLTSTPGPVHGDTYAQQTGLKGFRLANVHGRPLLVGDNVPNPKVWEFKQSNVTGTNDYSWVSTNATFPAITSPGFCSTLGSDNLPTGKAMLFGGWNAAPVVIVGGDKTGGDLFLSIPQTAGGRIFSSVQSGLIAVTYNGVPGISLAAGSTFAVFEIPVYNGTFDVAAYRASFAGSYIPSNLKVELSCDNGANWHTITPDSTYTVPDSLPAAVRRMRITLYNSVSSSPILTKLTEVLDADGVSQLEDPLRNIIRYNTPTSGGPYALYIDRFGIITFSATITPSTSQKAIIHKVTPNGSSAPAVKNYINRRRPQVKYTGLRASGTTPAFDNELAVPVRYVNALGVAVTSNAVSKIADPTVAFDASVTPAGLTNNGDSYIVELGG